MKIMKKAVLTKKYRALVNRQPKDMCVIHIHPTKPLKVVCEYPLGGYEVDYQTDKGYWSSGYLNREMFTYLSSKAKKRTGKRKRKLKQRKGTPRKGRK